MRKLSLREKAKIRGKRRRLRELRRWVAMFEGYFPEPERNGYGVLNWYAKLPVHAGLVIGRGAQRWFQRACIIALLDAAAHLREQKPSGQDVFVVALVPPADLFSASLDVYWGAQARDVSLGYPTLSQTRSLQREWGLPVRFPEKGYDARYEYENELWGGDLWAVGDVD